MGTRKGRAGHVVEADLVAELHGGGIAAVLAADAQLMSGRVRSWPSSHSHLHQLAYADLIQLGEGIVLIDLRCHSKRPGTCLRRHG